MNGDKIHIRPEYYETASEVMTHLLAHPATAAKQVIAIGGESGSGKSVLGQCLIETLLSKGTHTIILQLDDYFHLPPADNHAVRVRNLQHVGMQEVNMALLQQHIDSFQHGKKSIQAPVSSHIDNTITKKTLRFGKATTLIVEGTYALFLHNVNTKIYMSRTYNDTLAQRISRGRDIINDFTNNVLEIEHRIVAKSEEVADLVVMKDYTVVVKQK